MVTAVTSGPELKRQRQQAIRRLVAAGRIGSQRELVDGLTAVGNWVGMALATPVVFWAGWPFFVRAAQALRHRTANMFTLIALGTGAAWAYSAAATLAPAAFPAGFADAHGLIPTYFEAAAVITTLVLLGQVLELRARRSTGAAIRALLALGHLGAGVAHRRRVQARGGGSSARLAGGIVQLGQHLASDVVDLGRRGLAPFEPPPNRH